MNTSLQARQISLFSDHEEEGGDAIIQGIYRYLLTRWWGPAPETLLWVLLNPSVADASRSDPTLRRCIAFSKREGYQRMAIVNLFAFRATDPQELRLAQDPVGALNRSYVEQAAASAHKIVVAWGDQGTFLCQDQQVLEWLSAYQLWSLGQTKQHCPRHPLYRPADEPLHLFREKA
jgi:hypothetical protein